MEKIKRKRSYRTAIVLFSAIIFVWFIIGLRSGKVTAAFFCLNNYQSLDKNIRHIYVSIPFKFLPVYKLDKDSILLDEEGAGTFKVYSQDIAIVLVDTWNNNDPQEGQELPAYLKNLEEFLFRCREYGITVVHAPNHPVVDKYAQYHSIKEEVAQYLKKYSGEAIKPEFMEWPQKNNYSQVINQFRKEGRAAGYQLNPKNTRDISKYLKPLKNEYIVSTHDEFRYVLWKEKIKVLLYVGGALNECMLHRDTGINLLTGIDTQNAGFSIVVLQDCCYTMDSPNSDYEVGKQVMLDYYKRKIAVVANSKDIKFQIYPVNDEK